MQNQKELWFSVFMDGLDLVKILCLVLLHGTFLEKGWKVNLCTLILEVCIFHILTKWIRTRLVKSRQIYIYDW